MLETSLQGHNLAQCTRVLCCTKTANLEQWTNDFAHFNKESAQWICKNLPNLVLIGIDTPSVDSPNVAPIIASSHGQFWDHRVAIAENITFNRSQSIPQQAFLQTIWNPLQEADDARGCTMHLFNKM
jgi:kynurenine formamidase